MTEINNKIIANDIYHRLYWFMNPGGITSFNISNTPNYYYKLSNKDIEKEPHQTICDNNVDSLEDFYKIIEFVEKYLKNNINTVKEQAIIDVDDFNKSLYILIKLSAE
jgi:hypothetical protein